VVVVGGGPGGMEAAFICARRGHDVYLLEKGKELGGQLLLASQAPRKEKILWFRDYLVGALSREGVKVEPEKEASAEMVLNYGPDAVIVATGGEPVTPPFELDPSVTATAWEVLSGKVDIREKKVVVVGGGVVGCETSLFLAERDNWVTLVEMLPQVAYDAEIITRIELLKELNRENIKIMTQTRCMDVQAGKVIYLCDAAPSTSELAGDYIVFALGTQPKRELYQALQGKVPELFLVGDARMPRKIYQAVLEGMMAALRI
ncbi:MAG: FAD-dependent oxidoreductase, partial [Candidatus Caldatribacteriaceae bacterium]